MKRLFKIDKNLSTLILKIIFSTLFLTLSYYFFILQSRFEIPNAIIDFEKVISKHYYTLIENRAAYIELTRLNPTSVNFNLEKEELITKLVASNTSGLSALAENETFKKIDGVPNDKLRFLNDELPKKFISLKDQSKKIYENQKKIIENLTKLNSKTSKIFEYSPEADLGNLDLEKQPEQALERIANAKLGITKVKTFLGSDVDVNKGVITNLDDTLALFNRLEVAIKNKNNTEARNTLTALYNQLSTVRESIFLMEIDILKSNESVKLLVEETNLILDYKDLLVKLRNL